MGLLFIFTLTSLPGYFWRHEGGGIDDMVRIDPEVLDDRRALLETVIHEFSHVCDRITEEILFFQLSSLRTL